MTASHADTTSPHLAGLFTGLLDDAAVFPPGSLPLAEAVRAHAEHRRAAYSDLVGPLVVPAAELGVLAPTGPVDLAVTTSLPLAAVALAAAQGHPGVRLAALEVALPDDTGPGDVVPTLDHAREGADVTVYVEVPRDARRERVVEALAGTPYLAKLRTGGVRADLHPDEAELAAAVVALVRAGVPFKATAGLHHAVRNTDPRTGFEQHGFLNLLAATGAAAGAADVGEVAGLLAERDPGRVVAAVRRLDPSVRGWFRSFGTCSIAEPVAELEALWSA